MIKKILILLLIFVVKTGFCQFNVDTVTHTNVYNSGKYNFPIFSSENNRVAALKVNTYLQLTTLNLIVGKEDSIIFENDWPTKDSFHGQTYLNFEIIENSENILSVKINSEYCAAYCEGYEFYYNFNSKTGDLINLDELFTKEGYILFTDLINSQRKQTLLETIISCDNYILNSIEEAKSSGTIKEDLLFSIYEESNEEKDIYTDCLKHIGKYSFDKEFLLDNGSLHSYRGRCSAHVDRGMDAIGNFRNTVSLQKIKPLCSVYGKSILLDSPEVGFVISEEGKVYEGYLANKYKITLIIKEKRNDTVEATYCYEKYGKGIELSGEIKNDKIVLNERDKDWKKTGEIVLQFSEDKHSAKGFWHSSDNMKEMKLELKIIN